MSNLAQTISAKTVAQGTLALYWLAQAGFAFKTHLGKIVYVDPYFSDIVEQRFGFKRLMHCPIGPDEAEMDLLVCTHEHLDHMDLGALPAIAAKNGTHFAGPIECMKRFVELGLSTERCHLLEEGKSVELQGIKIKPVYADHGTLAPDALGIVFNFDGIVVYHTGDTAYRPQEFASAVEMRPDILLPCINGKYGNMDAHEAALLTQMVQPKLVIPTHYGMFAEHNGDPDVFRRECSELAPATQQVKLEPGEEFTFIKNQVRHEV